MHTNLTLSPLCGKGTRVEVNGHDLTTGVFGLTLTAAAGEVARLELNLPIVDTATVRGEADVYIGQATHDVLVALGWTPPTEECPYCRTPDEACPVHRAGTATTTAGEADAAPPLSRDPQ